MREGHRLIAWLTLLAGFVTFVWLPWLVGTGDAAPVGHALAVSAWLLVVGLVGEAVRVRRERGAERARAREDEGRRRIGEERLRISRELHDVLAHNVSLINVQSSVALHLLDEQPEQARAALAAIKEASAETLREMRGVLGALRDDGEALPRDPAPSLARLDELLAQVRGAGVTVDARIEGEPAALPAGVDLAAYRIVQEALTNVRRHAPGASARVRVAYRPADIEVEVDDDGPGIDELVAGNGLTGMRERAAALDGELITGPGARGGFRVLARLPR
jgi:signal transduction histidine kinase